MERAYEIAKRDLRRCYSEQGIHAGTKHFDDYWARDSLFACLGSLSIGDYKIVKKNLLLFLGFQRDGQIPMRVGNYFILPKILGLGMKDKLVARYVDDKFFNTAKDQNSLFIILCKEYLDKTEDSFFLEKNFQKIKKAMEWNLSDGILVSEGAYGSWADSVRKKGHVFFTNVLHYHALGCFSKICKLAGEDGRKYKELHSKVGRVLQEEFWNGRYFVDWIHKKKHDYFSTDGNLLAILFGLADKKQGEGIMECIDEFGINSDVPAKTNYPKYPFSKISYIDWAAGIGKYHNGMSWLWLGALDAIARNKLGNKDGAEEILGKMAEVINQYGAVYEIYENKKPVKTWLYRSESPFAWSAGMFVKACKEIYGDTFE